MPRTLISGRVDRSFATEMIDSGSTRIGSNQKPKSLVFMNFLLEIWYLKATVCSLHDMLLIAA